MFTADNYVLPCCVNECICSCYKCKINVKSTVGLSGGVDRFRYLNGYAYYLAISEYRCFFCDFIFCCGRACK